jgi:hypothetical protein
LDEEGIRNKKIESGEQFFIKQIIDDAFLKRFASED